MHLLCLGDIALIENSHKDIWPFSSNNITNDNTRILFNWELPIGNSTNTTPRTCGGPRLLSHPRSLEAIRNWVPGFAALATNHILDGEEKGLRDTLTALNDAGFITTGAGLTKDEITRPIIWMTDEGKVAIINWVFPETNPDWENGIGPNCWPGTENARKIVVNLKKENDWVIVFAHWSDEYFPYPRPEDRTIARELADAGADFIIGHHPHVVRGMEVINNCKVFYSLGNFYFSDYQKTISDKPSKWAPRCREGLGVRITLKNRDNPGTELMSFWQSDGCTILDSRKRARNRVLSTSKPLSKLSGKEYERWYHAQKSLFNRFWAKWHFGVRKLGFFGSIDYIKQKIHS